MFLYSENPKSETNSYKENLHYVLTFVALALGLKDFSSKILSINGRV